MYIHTYIVPDELQDETRSSYGGISMKRWTDPQKMKVLPELNLYHKIIQNTCKYQEKNIKLLGYCLL